MHVSQLTWRATIRRRRTRGRCARSPRQAAPRSDCATPQEARLQTPRQTTTRPTPPPAATTRDAAAWAACCTAWWLRCAPPWVQIRKACSPAVTIGTIRLHQQQQPHLQLAQQLQQRRQRSAAACRARLRSMCFKMFCEMFLRRCHCRLRWAAARLVAAAAGVLRAAPDLLRQRRRGALPSPRRQRAAARPRRCWRGWRCMRSPLATRAPWRSSGSASSARCAPNAMYTRN
jgi:hypothetical protein